MGWTKESTDHLKNRAAAGNQEAIDELEHRRQRNNINKANSNAKLIKERGSDRDTDNASGRNLKAGEVTRAVEKRMRQDRIEAERASKVASSEQTQTIERLTIPA